MRKLNRKSILPIATVVTALYCPCHAQVYSQNIYCSGGYYMGQSLFDIPVAPYHFMVEERGQYEDADGLVIIDCGHEKEDGGVFCRYIDVEIGPVSYSIWLDREPPAPVRKREAEEAEYERRLQTNLDSGYFQEKTFVLSNRAPDEAALSLLFDRDRGKIPDDGGIMGTVQGSNIVEITASTNNMVIWDRVFKEFDQPPTK